VRVKIYVEGGGHGQLLDTLFRQGWAEFFKKAGLSGRMPKVVRGTSRERTFDLFKIAVRNARREELPLLLVDSENPVGTGQTTWNHLRTHDGWERPEGVGEDQAFLMVQVMETWLLADRGLLRRYFGSALRENHLRPWPRLEDVPKRTVLDALHKATRGCPTPYAKGKISYELLRELNPRIVEEACPQASALLKHLRAL
jgi:hypothetical protein